MRGRLIRFWRQETGATALEFALIAVPLLMFTVGITEFGRALFMQQSLSHATDAAARTLYIDPTLTEAAIKAEILSNLFLAEPAQLQVTVGTPAAAAGTSRFKTLQLQVTYDFRSVVPAWITDRIPLKFQRTVIVAN